MNKNANLGVAIACFIAVLGMAYLLLDGANLFTGFLVIAINGCAIWMNISSYIAKRKEQS